MSGGYVVTWNYSATVNEFYTTQIFPAGIQLHLRIASKPAGPNGFETVYLAQFLDTAGTPGSRNDIPFQTYHSPALGEIEPVVNVPAGIHLGVRVCGLNSCETPVVQEGYNDQDGIWIYRLIFTNDWIIDVKLIEQPF